MAEAIVTLARAHATQSEVDEVEDAIREIKDALVEALKGGSPQGMRNSS